MAFEGVDRPVLLVKGVKVSTALEKIKFGVKRTAPLMTERREAVDGAQQRGVGGGDYDCAVMALCCCVFVMTLCCCDESTLSLYDGTHSWNALSTSTACAASWPTCLSMTHMPLPNNESI